MSLILDGLFIGLGIAPSYEKKRDHPGCIGETSNFQELIDHVARKPKQGLSREDGRIPSVNTLYSILVMQTIIKVKKIGNVLEIRNVLFSLGRHDPLI